VANRAGREATASADGERSGPVTLVEALERLLPHCEGNPHKVASRLDAEYRDGGIRLLGNGVAMAPNSSPSLLGIAAYIASDGKAVLYVDVRQALPGYSSSQPSWPVDHLEQHHRFWTFERASFEDRLRGTPKNPGGRPPVYDREGILIEAAVSVYKDGLPGPFTLEKFAAQVAARLGDGTPSSTWLEDLLRPLWKKLRASGQ
jgi:hypothetical protein